MSNTECNVLEKDGSLQTTYSVEEVAEMLGVCKTSAYKFVKSGQVQSVKVGRIIRVSKLSFDELFKLI